MIFIPFLAGPIIGTPAKNIVAQALYPSNVVETWGSIGEETDKLLEGANSDSRNAFYRGSTRGWLPWLVVALVCGTISAILLWMVAGYVV
jgi:hypothetical protein